MRVEWERSKGHRRWALQTSALIDHAVAALLMTIALAIAQLAGLPSHLVHMATRLL